MTIRDSQVIMKALVFTLMAQIGNCGKNEEIELQYLYTVIWIQIHN